MRSREPIWYVLGLSWAVGVLALVCYVNSRVDLLDWVYSDTWWHFPVAVACLIIYVGVWATLMSEGTMTGIYGNDHRRKYRGANRG
jgi:hypothetical protein